MYGTFLTALPTDMAKLMAADGVTVAGLLIVAAIVLYRMLKSQSEKAEKAHRDLVAAINASHEESQELLKQQLATLMVQAENQRQKLHDLDILRQKEWQEHYERMEELVSSYQKSQAEFGQSMKEMQIALKEVQTSIAEQTKYFKDRPSKD